MSERARKLLGEKASAFDVAVLEEWLRDAERRGAARMRARAVEAIASVTVKITDRYPERALALAIEHVQDLPLEEEPK